MPKHKVDVMPDWERPIRIPERISLMHTDPPFAIAGETGTWTLPLRLSESVAAGEELKFQIAGGRNNRGGFEAAQVGRPAEAGYLTAHAEDGAPLEIKSDDGGAQFSLTAPEGGLAEGDTITITLGDTSGGGPGIKAASARIHNKFFVLYRPPNQEVRMGCWGRESQDFIVAACTTHVLGGPIDHVHAWAPAQAAPGERVAILVRPEDEFSNLSSKLPGGLEVSQDGKPISADAEPVPGSTCVRLSVTAPEEGIYRFTVKHPATGSEATTNPMVCGAPPHENAYWGMIHGHSEMSDGTDTLNNYFHQLRNEAALDFGAPGDHDHLWETSDEMWAVTCERVKQWHEDGRFVTLLGYEWAKWRKNGDGDRNVYYLEDDRPFFRSDHGEYPSPPDLFEALRNETAMVIPHHPGHIGNFCDYKDHDPVCERLIEIYQVRGSYECSEEDGNPIPERKGDEPYVDGFVRRALALGWRAGFTAGGDDHGGTAGTGKSKDGLMCIFAPDLTRKAVWDAMWGRRVVATSGPRILLWYEVSGNPMGAELDAARDASLQDKRELHVVLHGTAPAKQVDVIRNNEVVHSERPDALDCELRWTDETPLKDALMPPAQFCDHPFCFYYVRVVQQDGEAAWASPLWIDGA